MNWVLHHHIIILKMFLIFDLYHSINSILTQDNQLQPIHKIHHSGTFLIPYSFVHTYPSLLNLCVHQKNAKKLPLPLPFQLLGAPCLCREVKWQVAGLWLIISLIKLLYRMCCLIIFIAFFYDLWGVVTAWNNSHIQLFIHHLFLCQVKKKKKRWSLRAQSLYHNLFSFFAGLI